MIKRMIYEQERHARLNLIPQRGGVGGHTDYILKEVRGQFSKLQIVQGDKNLI